MTINNLEDASKFIREKYMQNITLKEFITKSFKLLKSGLTWNF